MNSYFDMIEPRGEAHAKRGEKMSSQVHKDIPGLTLEEKPSAGPAKETIKEPSLEEKLARIKGMK